MKKKALYIIMHKTFFGKEIKIYSDIWIITLTLLQIQ